MGYSEKKTCYVIMGYGEKVDFQTGRTLNLDATYYHMIKPAVEAAGLTCMRADEIVNPRLIDVPRYELLLQADVVIADLSANNPNDFYELGVRHALRPSTTIMIAEEQFHYPFDAGHIVIRRYRHLGEDISVDEAQRFRTQLINALKELLKYPEQQDSPVYTFLHNLRPPDYMSSKQAVAAVVEDAGDMREGTTLSELMRGAKRAQKSGDFITAKTLLRTIRDLQRPISYDDPRQADPYITQQLALVTYKSKFPTPQKALEEARDLLLTLNPETSNDTETLGMWGAVHKRLWDETRDRKHLDEAVRGYERGFYLRNDYYNGINLAYLLNVRAANANSPAEAVADFVQAERIRREVIGICESALKDAGQSADSKYWILATMAEAYLGAGDEANADKSFQEAAALASADWMKQSTTEQMDKLRALLKDSPLNRFNSGTS